MEYVLVFPDRDDAEEVADELSEEGFSSVRIVSERLADDDAYDEDQADDSPSTDWVVYVVQSTLDDPAGAPARALTERFTALAQEHSGWLDDDRSTAD